MDTKKHLDLIILVGLTILIKIFSLFPEAVERYYSDGIYQVISKAQRLLLGWIPFSIGDILYFVVGLYLLVKAINFIRKLISRKVGKAAFLQLGRNLLVASLFVYTLFNILWGLNYNRVGIAKQLDLKKQDVKTADLIAMMEQIVTRVNNLDTSARSNRPVFKTNKYIFNGSIASYKSLEKKTEIFHYSTPSIKPSLYSYLGNYMGFSGYYNPFSGEAQANTTVPLFIQPFINCHEIGHQLGYAKESEANFAGFLSASSSLDPVFRYSAYFDLYLYGRRYLYLADSTKGKQLDSALNPGVKKDIRELREFVKRHANPIEEVIDFVYGHYLKANEQPSGRVSYSEVIVWAIAYYKKYGTI